MVTAKNTDMPIATGSLPELKYQLNKQMLPAMTRELNKGGQIASVYFCLDASVIFLENRYQTKSIPAMLRITQTAAPEIPTFTVIG